MENAGKYRLHCIYQSKLIKSKKFQRLSFCQNYMYLFINNFQFFIQYIMLVQSLCFSVKYFYFYKKQEMFLIITINANVTAAQEQVTLWNEYTPSTTLVFCKYSSIICFLLSFLYVTLSATQKKSKTVLI